MKSPQHLVNLSSLLHRLLRDHRIWCTVDCCKERAFQFTDVSIARWLSIERIDREREITTEIGQLTTEIGKIASDLQQATGKVILNARELESDWPADQFKLFWQNFARAFTLAIEATKRAAVLGSVASSF